MFQDDMNGKDESGVYEIKYGDHMFFVPKRMDDGVEAIMAIERICCRGFSFKRKRKKLIGFMRDIWAFAIDEDRREIAGRIEREFAGRELEKLKLHVAFVVACFFVAGKSSACKAKLPEAPRYSAACKKNPTKICTSRKIWYTIYVSEKDSSFRDVRRIRRRNSFLSTCVPRLNAAAFLLPAKSDILYV